MGQMTIVAGGQGMMAGLGPAGVLIVHDVAVHARLGIVAEVAQSLGVIEREDAKPEAHAKQNCGEKNQAGFESNHSHMRLRQYTSRNVISQPRRMAMTLCRRLQKRWRSIATGHP